MLLSTLSIIPQTHFKVNTFFVEICRNYKDFFQYVFRHTFIFLQVLHPPLYTLYFAIV